MVDESRFKIFKDACDSLTELSHSKEHIVSPEPRRDSRRLISLSQAAMADPCSV